MNKTLEQIRNQFYNDLPVGDVGSWELLQHIKTHLSKLDELISQQSYAVSEDADGWSYDYKFLKDITYEINQKENGDSLSMEEVEVVLLAINYPKSGYAAAPQKGITIKKFHDKIVLTNENGDTYTSRSEELADSLHKVNSFNLSPSDSEAGDGVEFLDWVAKEDYKPGAQNEHWFKWEGMDVIDEPLTTAQLYARFKNNKTPQ